MSPRHVTVILLTAVVAACDVATTPEGAVEGFYHAVEKGDTGNAKGYLSATIVNTFPDEKITAGLQRGAQEIQQCGGIKSIRADLVGAGDVRSGTSSIEYGGKCPKKTERVKVVREDGHWKLAPSK